MTYAVSDLHGCYDKYQELLRAISFGKNDTLYVLGDVIDRGLDGFQILLDMAQQPNVINLMGNHEVMAISISPSDIERKGSLRHSRCRDSSFLTI